MQDAWLFGSPPSGAGGGTGPGPGGELRPGQAFGPYLILDPLGAGGMGAVFRARDPAGRDVALKVIRGGLNDRRRARFRREGELTSRLVHPGIIRVFGGGELQGIPFLVYELVEGATDLALAFRREPLRRRVELVRDTAAAVGHAHHDGVLHRDLKPDNVLIDAQGSVRVADFGLSKAESSERLTQTGAVLGTLGYMSPEQLAGEALDARSDVWSLGVILYQALCQRLPFEVGTPTELQARMLRGRPTHPSSVDPAVPRELARVCLRALAPEPDARFADGAELAEALSAWLRGERLVEPRGGPLARLAGVLVLVGVVGVLVASWFPRSAAEPPHSQAAPPSPLHGEPDPAGQRTVATAEADQRWGEILALPTDRQLPAAWVWLTRNPAHARADEARALVERQRRRRPVLRISRPRRANLRVQCLDDERVLVYSTGLATYALGEGLLEERFPKEFVHRVFVLDGGDWLLSYGGKLARLQGDQLPPRWQGAQDRRLFACDPHGRWAAAVGDDSPVEILDLASGELLHSLSRDQRRAPWALLATEDGRLLALHGGAGRAAALAASTMILRAYDAESGELLVSNEGLPPASTGTLAARPGGQELALGTLGGELLILDAHSLERLRACQDPAVASNSLMVGGAHPGVIGAVTYTPDGRRILSGSGTGGDGAGHELKTWDADTGAPIDEPVTLPGPVFRAYVSPSGRLIGLGYERGEGEVWILELP